MREQGPAEGTEQDSVQLNKPTARCHELYKGCREKQGKPPVLRKLRTQSILSFDNIFLLHQEKISHKINYGFH
jgi:hypothetical protein